jgi:outer membrane protein
MKFAAIVVLPVLCLAQDGKLTFKETVQRAAERYPSIQVTRAQVNEAAASVALARNAFLPRVDGVAQVNRATANNVFGLMFPTPVIPPISGPQIDGDQTRNVFGSSVGLLVSWEPFDFGRRKADVDIASAARARAEAAVARTKLDVSAAAADAYLTALAAEQAVAAAKAGITRNKEFEKVIEALTKADLRPGADLARVQAEIILVETQVARAEQSVAQARALVEQYVGAPVKEMDAAPFVREAPAENAPAPGIAATHPQLLEQQTAIEEIIAKLKAVDKGWYPRFAIQGAAFGRGSGARVAGPFPAAGAGSIRTMATGPSGSRPPSRCWTSRIRRRSGKWKCSGRTASRRAASWWNGS